MSKTNNLDVSVKLRITDKKSTNNFPHDGDVYSLYVDESDDYFVGKTYREDRRNFDYFWDHANLNLGQIPDRVAAAMQQYTGNKISWPNSVASNQIDVEKQEAHISLRNGEDFEFSVYQGKHVRITKNDSPVRIDDITQSVRQEAENYLPANPEYL